MDGPEGLLDDSEASPKRIPRASGGIPRATALLFFYSIFSLRSLRIMYSFH